MSYTSLNAQLESPVLDYYTDGGDTVFYEPPEEIIEEARFMPHNYDIEIKLGYDTEEVSDGLYGWNIADMFGQKQMPEGIYGEDQWQWMSDLAPKVIRIPSGAGSTFMHLLHHPTLNTDGIGERDYSQGYGYVIEEIVQFFDVTDADGIGNAPSVSTILAFEDEDLAVAAWGDEVTGWLDANLARHCFKLTEKYEEQLLLPENTNYLDQFIRLVKKIEEENEEKNLRVKVIVCLNIISETPEECKNIVQYLRDNDIYDVDVYGVEMGNETYSYFFQKAMGFIGFGQYYNYITGDDVVGFDVDEVIPSFMVDNHDFITMFKSSWGFNCKVAIVGNDDPGDEGPYALKKYEEAPILIPADWNVQIPDYYDETVDVTGTSFTRKAFDAVVLHPYYGTSNYKDILIDNLEEDYPCSLTEPAPWDFENYDSRLADAFDGMREKFLVLFKSEFKESIDRWSYDLGFDLTLGQNGKELWITEWNYKDQGDGIAINQQDRVESVSNTFLQGMVVSEWWLKHMKLNFDADYRKNFMPFATFHNWGGGGNNEMLNFADKIELEHYGLCDEAYWESGDDKRYYYLKHTPYFAFELLKEIKANDLEYLKCNFGIQYLYGNIQPTVFIDASREFLYIYYSNVFGFEQDYALNTSNFLDVFEGDPESVDVLSATIYRVKAAQPYSTAGKCTIYDLNLCYDAPGDPEYPTDCEDDPDMPFPIGGDYGIEAISNEPNVPDCGVAIPEDLCITVPSYSFGYIKVHVEPQYEERNAGQSTSNTIIYPNPATAKIYIKSELEISHAKVISSEGKTVIDNITGNIADLSLLPSGCYILYIAYMNFTSEVKLIIRD